ncbi:MAG: aminodeoxychorismate/anthranilate synthase component II [Alphaproteobacteria bacterium]|nr:aminodeoxychorismate/anthranilate synthase component II [Alphaproteobacteria bacterium]
MIILIDNYDSFTYNLYHYLLEGGAEVEVHRNDQITINEIVAKEPNGIVLSPGSGTPDDAAICKDTILNFDDHKIPVLGVCLGHQTIGQMFGGTVLRGEKPMHAKISTMEHYQNNPIFKGIPTTFKATRYHSLIVEKESLPNCLEISATSSDGVIQAMHHNELPIFGLQFHPESIASEYGHEMINNFLEICRNYGATK